MAFTPDTLSAVVQSIGGTGIRMFTYETDDSVATVTGADYFKKATSRGLRVSDLIFTSPLDADGEPYTLVIETIDADGHGTASAIGLNVGIDTYRVHSRDSAATVDLSGFNQVIVNRWSDTSPLAPALYQKVAAEPSYSAKFQDSTGTWFAYVVTDKGVNARHMGAHGTAFGGLAGGITAADQTFVDVNARFTAAHVGATIVIGGAGVAGANLTTTIASVTNTTTVELTAAASTTVRGAEWVCYLADDTSAAQRTSSNALALGVPLYFPAGGYYITNSIHTGSSGSQTPDDYTVLGDGANTVFWHAVNNTLFTIYGGGLVAQGSSPTFTAIGDPTDQTITVSSTATLSVGDWLHIIDTSATDDHPIAAGVSWPRGEVNRVKEIVDGTTLILETPLERTYTVGTFIQRYINQVERTTFRGLRFYNAIPGGAGSAQTAIGGYCTHRFRADDVSVYGLDRHGISISHSHDFHITTGDFDRARNENAFDPYSIRIDAGCWNGTITGAKGRRGRHLITSAGSTTFAGPDHIRVIDCNMTGADLAGQDMHPGGRFWMFINPYVNAGGIPGFVGGTSGMGIQIRGWGTTVINPIVYNASIGVYIVNAMHCRVVGGRLINCVVGARRRRSPGSGFDGTIVENPITTGFYYSEEGVAAGETGGFTRRTQVIGNPTGYAYDFDHWPADEYASAEDMLAYDATLQYRNIPHDTLYGGTMATGTVKVESGPRALVGNSTITPLTSGALLMVAVHLPKGLRVTKLSHIAGTAADTQTNFWMSIHDRNRNRLGVTSDAGASTTTGFRSLDLATPFTTQYAGTYYVGINCVAATTQGMRGYAGSATAVVTAPILCGTSASTGLTNPASCPATAGTLTANGSVPWVGVG